MESSIQQLAAAKYWEQRADKVREWLNPLCTVMTALSLTHIVLLLTHVPFVVATGLTLVVLFPIQLGLYLVWNKWITRSLRLRRAK